MSLIDRMKKQVKQFGGNKGKIVYLKSGVKNRIRFLTELDAGIVIPFHDSFNLGINAPCQTLYDRECPYCEDEELRHRELYAWSVYDYDSNEVKILLYPANNFSPVPALVGMYETYGTILDRDYVITKNGQQTSITYSVVPMDKAVFRNKKAKAYSEEKMLSIIDKAFPVEEDVEEDEEDEKPRKKKASADKKKEKKCEDCGKPISKCICDEEDDEDEISEEDYYAMTPKELYNLCQERNIKVKPKQKASYYIDLLEEQDEESDEEDENEDW